MVMKFAGTRVDEAVRAGSNGALADFDDDGDTVIDGAALDGLPVDVDIEIEARLQLDVDVS